MLPGSDDLLFWFLAAAMTALALGFVLPRLLTGRVAGDRMRPSELNTAIYRRELAELDRERSDERISDGQYASYRTELERRLLADVADDAATSPPAAPPRVAAIIIGVALPALAFGLYAVFGEPGVLDASSAGTFAANPGSTGVTIRRDDLVRHLDRNARDGRGWIVLARMDFEADRFTDAAASYRKALAASPKIAADADVWCEYADALGMAQGGTLAGEPRELVLRALALNAAHRKALEMAGSAAFEQREFTAAAGYWRQLLAQLVDGSRQHRELAAAIARADRMAVANGGVETLR